MTSDFEQDLRMRNAPAAVEDDGVGAVVDVAREVEDDDAERSGCCYRF